MVGQLPEGAFPPFVGRQAVGEQEYHGPQHRHSYAVQVIHVGVDAAAKQAERGSVVGHAVALDLRHLRDTFEIGHLDNEVRIGREDNQRDISELGHPGVVPDGRVDIGQGLVEYLLMRSH